MLPYRLRPPSFATKELRAKKQEQETNEEMLSGGGPIQRAMELDLIELRPRFLERVESLSSVTPQQHYSAGEAFGCFKQVFGQAKVALVHTRTLPPRSDRGSYTQLLYSTCLSLLKCSFEEHDEVVLEHAAFATFCLYALYETCPLPSEPSNPLQLLPMGLQHPDNPKFLYRRSFRSPIRIDRYHYSLFQRLRDEALARQAECQCARMRAWESRVTEDTSETEWTCNCGTAVDIVHVVDRLMPSLDLAEYTGPAGLEALAGHADYPYRCIRPKKAKRKRRKDTTPVNVTETAVTTKLMDEDLDAIVETGQAEPPSQNLDESIKRYRSRLKEIHLAPANATASRQDFRVRDVLKPIFDSSPEPAMNEMSAANEYDNQVVNDSVSDTQGTTTLVSTHTTASLPENADSGILLDSTRDDNTNEVAAPEHPRKNPLDDLNCRLVFPADLPEAQRDGIRAALNSAIDMGDLLIEPETEAMNGSGKQSGDESVSSSTSSHVNGDEEDSAENDDISGLGDWHGQGATALHNLLSEALAGTPALSGLNVATVPREREAAASVNILSSNSDLQDEGLASETVHSDMSIVSSEGSDATAAIGGMSLQTLWSSVDQDDEQPTRQRPRQKKRKRGRPPSAEAGSRRKARQRKPKSLPQSEKRYQIGDRQLNLSEEDSEGSTAVGGTALQALFSAVHEDDDKQDEPMSRQRQPKKAKRQRMPSPGGKIQGMKGPRKTQERFKESDGPPRMSSEDSVVSMEVGQTSLQALFAAVRGDGELMQQRLPSRKRQTLSTADGLPDKDGPHSMSIPSRSQKEEFDESDDHSLSSTWEPGKTGKGSDNSQSESDEKPTRPSDDDSVSSCQGQGRAALGALLSLAARRNDATY